MKTHEPMGTVAHGSSPSSLACVYAPRTSPRLPSSLHPGPAPPSWGPEGKKAGPGGVLTSSRPSRRDMNPLPHVLRYARESLLGLPLSPASPHCILPHSWPGGGGSLDEHRVISAAPPPRAQVAPPLTENTASGPRENAGVSWQPVAPLSEAAASSQPPPSCCCQSSSADSRVTPGAGAQRSSCFFLATPARCLTPSSRSPREACACR